jgi:hypothetical protein
MVYSRLGSIGVVLLTSASHGPANLSLDLANEWISGGLLISNALQSTLVKKIDSHNRLVHVGLKKKQSSRAVRFWNFGSEFGGGRGTKRQCYHMVMGLHMRFLKLLLPV